uniref:TLC domain-containing protein n=1 Tax=Clytia hemisphaerica TaxID=252671 RepID=A0A7M5XFW2_9CNID
MEQVILAALCWTLMHLSIEKIFGSKWVIVTYGIFGWTVPRFIEYYFYRNPGQLDFNRCGEAGLTEFERKVLIYASGYFLFDIFNGVRMREGFIWQIHHSVSFLVVASPLYYEKCAFELFLCLWVGEFTSLFAFWIFRYEKEPEIYNSKPMLVVKIVYFTLFMILRFCVGSYALWRFLNSPDTLFIIKLGCLLMTVFNCVIVKQAIDEVKRFILPDNKKNEY